jgi:Ca-activated chloride channel family protein
VIEWGSPWAFLLLVPVLLLPWQPRWTGRLRLTVPGLQVHQAGWTARRALAGLPRLLQVLGLFLVVVALARPRITHRSVVVESDGLDIMLAIDTSGSMRAQDFAGPRGAATRLDVAKAVMAEFVAERPHDRIGLVVFGEEAFTYVPLTLDHDTLADVLDSVQIGIAGESRTAVGSAIAIASKRLKDLEAESRLVILLTDGQSNAGHLEPLEAAQLAAALDIRVYTIGIGGPPRRDFFGRSSDEVDEQTLRAVAEATDAQYFRARDARALQEVYATIDELEPSPAEVEELTHHEELYRRALVPGLLLLVMQLLLSTTWLRRFP